jgi:adenosylcobinamide-GDP ribazoletransferase
MIFKQHYHALILAFQFLTRIPVYRVFTIANTAPTEQVAGKALLYYPLVGIVMGIYLLVLPWLVQYYGLGMSAGLQAGLVLVLWVWLTGALHLDGLADSADAWLGGFGDKQRTLDLMKDPTCGPAAVVVLVLVLLVKWLALTEVLGLLAGASDGVIYMALLCVPVMARCQAMVLVVHTPYVRGQGLGTQLKNQAQSLWVWLQLLVLGLLTTYVLGLVFVALLAALVVGYWLMRRLMLQRIDGWTGDTAGASIEVTELILLLALTFCLN